LTSICSEAGNVGEAKDAILLVAVVAMASGQHVGIWEDTAAEDTDADADDEIEPASLRPAQRTAF